MPDAPPREAPPRGYPAFAAGVASWFGALGMQQVLFSWIVVGELRAPAEWVGVTQTSTMLPSLVLLLFGGAVADRIDPRRLLIGVHVLAAVPIVALAAALSAGHVDIVTLIGFGLSIGTVSAFALPSRDALLSRVAGHDMMRAVTTATAIQFGSQALGTLLAGLARWTGSPAMLCVQAVILLSGSIFTRGIPAAVAQAPGSAPPRESHLREIADGLREVAQNPSLRSPFAMVACVGVLFIGPFLVVFPLLVRDHYQAGVDMLSIVLTLFPLGTITGSLVLRVRGVRRKGQAALLALAVGAATLAAIGVGVPFWLMVVLTMVWGLAGSVFINCSRTLYQEAAPPAQRGRVLAIYQMGFMGGAPLGALGSGFLVGAVGLHGTLLATAGTMGLLVVAMWTLSDMRRLE